MSDPTGSQRFSIFAISSFCNKSGGFKAPNDIETWQKNNMEQVWAWAYAKYKEGFDTEYTTEELKQNEEENENYKQTLKSMKLYKNI